MRFFKKKPIPPIATTREEHLLEIEEEIKKQNSFFGRLKFLFMVIFSFDFFLFILATTLGFFIAHILFEILPK